MKIDVTILKEGRKENTHKRNLLIANLKEQVIDSINSYLANLGTQIPAGAETLAISLNAFFVRENTLYVDLDKAFLSSSTVKLAGYEVYDIIPLCSVKGAVLAVPEKKFEYTHSFMPKETLRVTKFSEITLYYNENLGEIPLSEIWEEEIPETFSISLI